MVYHDLALIRLARPVTFSDMVRPYCLAGPGEDLPGTRARVAGIGAKEFGEWARLGWDDMGEGGGAADGGPLSVLSWMKRDMERDKRTFMV